MHKLLTRLLDSVGDGRAVTYCRLVETRGSTPQKAGATMLVFADGSQAGTLGGGCVEAEVRRRALAVLAEGRPEIVSFQLDNDYGWDDGLICGGRMQVLIEPLAPAADVSYFRRLHELMESATGCVEAIVFDGQKSGLAAPAAYLFDADNNLVANRHGAGPSDRTPGDRTPGDGTPGDCGPAGDAPDSVRAALPSLAARPRASSIHGIAILPNLPRCRLLIVGGGHIGQAVGNLAPELDFDVWVLDDRAEYVSRERFPRAERLIQGDIGATLESLEVTGNTYCLIVTRGHNHDEEALCHLVDRKARYVGMIGSRRKIKLIFDDLEAEGISAETLSRVYAPVGIDIGSQTVAEIALSILAELVAHRNLGGEVPGRPASALSGGSA